jgi:hypothetical protein
MYYMVPPKLTDEYMIHLPGIRKLHPNDQHIYAPGSKKSPFRVRAMESVLDQSNLTLTKIDLYDRVPEKPQNSIKVCDSLLSIKEINISMPLMSQSIEYKMNDFNSTLISDHDDILRFYKPKPKLKPTVKPPVRKLDVIPPCPAPPGDEKEEEEKYSEGLTDVTEWRYIELDDIPYDDYISYVNPFSVFTSTQYKYVAINPDWSHEPVCWLPFLYRHIRDIVKTPSVIYPTEEFMWHYLFEFLNALKSKTPQWG